MMHFINLLMPSYVVDIFFCFLLKSLRCGSIFVENKIGRNMRDYSFETDTELLKNIDYFLEISGHVNDKYKVLEIIRRCVDCVCLDDVKALEKLLCFDIRGCMFCSPGQYLGVDGYYVRSISDVNKYIRKSVPLAKNMDRRTNYPKIDFFDLRAVLVNCR